MSHYDYLLKILLIGDSGAGKSSVLLKFTDDIFLSQYASTIGIDFKVKTIEEEGMFCRLQMWDTAGQEKFRTVTSSYYRGAHGIIIVFDTTNLISFYNIKKWIEEAERNCNQDVSIVLVGTKGDLDSMVGQEMIDKMIDELANGRSITYVRCSSVNGIGIDKVFHTLVKQILLNIKENKIQIKRKENNTLPNKSSNSNILALNNLTGSNNLNCC